MCKLEIKNQVLKALDEATYVSIHDICWNLEPKLFSAACLETSYQTFDETEELVLEISSTVRESVRLCTNFRKNI